MHIVWVCMYIYIFIYVVFGQQRLARECLEMTDGVVLRTILDE